MNWAVAILGLAFLILIHEAGHFFAAKAVGMRPRKFYLGFPPALVKKVHGGVEYGIGTIPLGGYVKIPGMHRAAPGDLRASLKQEQQDRLALELDELDDALERGDDAAARAVLPRLQAELGDIRQVQDLEGALAPDAYWRQATWRRIVAIAAGPAVNVLAAVVLFVGVYSVGVPVASRMIDSVLAGHPAAVAGLQKGDTILAVAGHPVTPATLHTRIDATHGKPFLLTIERNDRKLTIGPLRATKGTNGYTIGVYLAAPPGPGQPLPRATVSAARFAWDLTDAQLSGIAGLAHGKGTHQVSSSVGIVNYTAQAYKTSLRDYFAFLGYISLALALLNLLPILPLDGGHIVMAIIERFRGRTFTQLAYLRYSAVGLSLVLIVFYLGVTNDIHNLGGG